MDEPTTSVAGGLLAKGLASIGFGAIGALIMAAFDPPKTRRALFWQALASAAGSLVFGHAALRVLDHFTPWVDIMSLPQDQWIEWAAPVYFVVDALAAAGGLTPYATYVPSDASPPYQLWARSASTLGSPLGCDLVSVQYAGSTGATIEVLP